jgi:hypothetical protein
VECLPSGWVSQCHSSLWRIRKVPTNLQAGTDSPTKLTRRWQPTGVLTTCSRPLLPCARRDGPIRYLGNSNPRR